MRGRIWKLGVIGGTVAATYIFERKGFSELPGVTKKIQVVAEEERHSPLHSFTLNQPLDLSGQHRTGECVLVVGTTGSGKSSTISKMTGQRVRVSASYDSVTQHCEAYQDVQGGSNLVWVDTIGYDDSRNLEDEESFKSLLRFLAKEGLTKVKAVVWTVLPQERRDQRLQKQADFINQLSPGSIWANTVILVKQPGSFNLSLAAQGAKEAAKIHCYQGEELDIQVLGFTYLDSNIPDEVKERLPSLDADIRHKMLVYTDEEVVDTVGSSLKKIEDSRQVIFEDEKCVDCGEVGDARLLSSFCHMEPQFSHPLGLQHHHPGGEPQPFHPIQRMEGYHPGVLRLTGGPCETCKSIRNNIGLVGLLLLPFAPPIGAMACSASVALYYGCAHLDKPLLNTFSCCEGDQQAPFCKSRYPCCQGGSSHPGCCFAYPCCQGGLQAQGCNIRYRCCQRPEGSTGCKEVCRKCGLDWGSPAGQCFRKKHSTRKIYTE